jgi:hypothetical protein
MHSRRLILLTAGLCLLVSSSFALPLFDARVSYYASGSASICPTDIDGDGDIDLALIGGYGISILGNRGDGTFVAPGYCCDMGAFGNSPESVCAADLDGDGDNDLAVASSDVGVALTFMNNGNGTFGAFTVYGAGLGAISICAADLNGDGDIDLAVANFLSDNVSILENDGDGTFETAVNYGVGTLPIYVCTADLDGDGDSDLAVANLFSEDVSILKNHGDGTFAAAENYDVGANAGPICTADLDGDGDNDLAVANFSSDEISILENYGDSTFATAVNYRVGGNAGPICVADFDEDGDNDLAVVNSADSVSILENYGDSTFAAAVNYDVGSAPGSICVADLDGDGDSDLAVTHSDSVSILINVSADHIAPAVPTGFTVAYNTGSGNLLSWDPCPDGDFDCFRVYRSSDPDFIPSPSELIDSLTGTNWNDPDYDGWPVYYRLTALDFVGNESDPAAPETVTGVTASVIPQTYGLYPNVPNPFNPTTTIGYDVPAGGSQVTLRIYDVAGRLVRTLVNGTQKPGRKTVVWDGRSGSGQMVATGVYFYRMTAPGFEQTRKMVVMK